MTNMVKQDVKQLIYERTQGGEFRWITISTFMLALGTILHLVSPSVAGVTPNWTIAMYSVAILLVKPTYRQALGIGFVAALVNMLTSKSAFPYANLLSEPTGALTCAVIVLALGNVKVGKLDVKPFLCGFLATMFSGATFVTTLFFVLGLPQQVLFFVMFPMVLAVALVNMLVTGAVYFPAKRYLTVKGVLSDEEAVVSDHSDYVLIPSQDGQVSIEHLTYQYGRSSKKALDDVTLNINRGDFLIITGPSGCGKTTLSMALSGGIPHFYGGKMSGMVFIDGNAITQTSIADLSLHVGMVLADYDTQLVTMTVGEEVAFAMENRGYDAETIQRRTKEVLAQVHLDGLENRSIQDMSGGQRQRLAIASVLATEPSLLILDEPTSSLDPEGTEELYAIIGKLNRENKVTVVVIDDNLSASIPYANRMAVLVDGKLAYEGAVEEAMDYMYDMNTYPEALPALYTMQRRLKEKGINLGKVLKTPEEVVAALQNKEATCSN